MGALRTLYDDGHSFKIELGALRESLDLGVIEIRFKNFVVSFGHTQV